MVALDIEPFRNSLTCRRLDVLDPDPECDEGAPREDETALCEEEMALWDEENPSWAFRGDVGVDGRGV